MSRNANKLFKIIFMDVFLTIFNAWKKDSVSQEQLDDSWRTLSAECTCFAAKMVKVVDLSEMQRSLTDTVNA